MDKYRIRKNYDKVVVEHKSYRGWTLEGVFNSEIMARNWLREMKRAKAL